jgi:hypothetical protein
MSAYLVDPEMIGQIAHIILDHVKLNPDLDREFVIGVLAVQNIRSLKARYEDNRGLTADGVVNQWMSGIETFGEYLDMARNVVYSEAPASIIDRVATLDSYAYQSCETEDWEGTLSHLLIDKTKELLNGDQGEMTLDLG